MTAASDRVVDAALDAFAAHGYNGVSMRDLADLLGIRAPSLYSHFPSKAHLLAACLAPLTTRIDTLLSQPPTAAATGTDLEAWLTDLIGALAADPRAARILATDPALRQIPALTSHLDERARRFFAVLDGFGVPDRVAATALLGAVLLPVTTGLVSGPNAANLARTSMRLLNLTPAAS